MSQKHHHPSYNLIRITKTLFELSKTLIIVPQLVETLPHSLKK
ncbi:MAG: hypothetical protein ACSHYB_01540 [Roseibacillus sp.]